MVVLHEVALLAVAVVPVVVLLVVLLVVLSGVVLVDCHTTVAVMAPYLSYSLDT
jgi:hypothetical protein